MSRTLLIDSIVRQTTVLIASLWPETRPCIVPALYLQLPAPALFGAAFRVSWEWRENDAHARRVPLPRAEGVLQVAWAA